MPSVTDSKHNQKYFIENLKEKLKVIEIAMNIDLKELFSEKGTLSYNTIDCWLKGKTTPQKRKFEIFCREIDIEVFDKPLVSFKEAISNKFKIDKDKFSEIKTENCEDILARTRSSQSLEEIEEFFRDHLVGHWVGVHYWEKFPWDKKEKLCDSDENKRYLFRHVFHFFKFDRKRKTIRFSFSSARRAEKEWNYQGDVIFSKNKLYFIMEKTGRQGEMEVALIIANRPVDVTEYIHGIILATIRQNDSSGTEGTAATRILFKKIDNCQEQSKEHLETYAGIYDEDCFNDDLKNMLNNDLQKNSRDKEIGILFPNLDSNIFAKVMGNQEKSILTPNKKDIA